MININDIQKAMQEMYDKSEFIKYMDIEFTEIAEDKLTGRMKFDKKYLNPYGTMHGGCLYSLADTVAGSLACIGGTYVTTVEGVLNFLNPAANTEYVYCEAHIMKAGRKLINVEVVLRGDDGTVFDTGSFNYFKMD